MRQARGWTQAELGRAAGYTGRLIRKAETGNPIAMKTIRDLADALTLDDAPVTVNDLISDPLLLGKQFIFGLYQFQGDVVAELAEMIDDQVFVIIAGSEMEIPFAGSYRGRAAVDAAFRKFFHYLQTPANHDPQAHYEFVAEDSRVICWGKSWFHPRGGPTLAQAVNVSILMKFADGKLTHFDDRFDTENGSRIMKEFT